MTQHINLLPPSGESARDALTLPAILWAALATLGLAAGASLWWRPDVARLTREVSSLKQQIAANNLAYGTRRIALDGTLARRLDEARERSARLVQAHERLRELDANTPEHFSTFFDALSRQTMPGVWLTAFAADGPDRRLVMAGRAMSAELVPGYLQRLQREPAFQSRRFASLELEDRPVGIARPDDAAGGQRVVEFRLQSDAAARGAKAGRS